MENLIYYLTGIGVLALAFALWKTRRVYLQEKANQKASDFSAHIRNATFTFLKTEYNVLSVFIILVAVLLFLQSRFTDDSNEFLAISFVVGAAFSSLAGYLSIYASSYSDNRTVKASESSVNKAFRTAFSGGAAIGIGNVAFAIIGLSVLFLISQLFGDKWELSTSINMLTGYALGVSTVALFDRIIGGVYAQAANDGEKLVIKTEEAIPENSAVNPAEIAKGTATNINNITGAGSDLFESFVAAIIAAMILGIPFLNAEAVYSHFSFGPIMLPITIATVGLLCSITSNFIVNTIESENFWTSYRFSNYFSAAIIAIASFFVIKYMLPAEWEISNTVNEQLIITKFKSLGIFWSLFIGLSSGILISLFTEFYTTSENLVDKVVEKSFNGPSSNILSSISSGFLSSFGPVIIVATTVISSYYFAGFYGIAIAAVGMLANTATVFTINSFKPIVENAGYLAKISGQAEEIEQTINELNKIGDKKELIVKSFTISAAALTAFALFSAYLQKTGTSLFEISDPLIIGAILIGAIIPFLFSSFVVSGINEVATKLAIEVKRQFNEIPKLIAALDIYKKYYGDPNVPDNEEEEILANAEGVAEFEDLVEISTYNAVREIIIPIVITVAIPALAGYFGGTALLAGILSGLIPVGFVLAISQANSGAIWRSAKNQIVKGVLRNDEIYGKNSEAYKNAQFGDSVGKHFKNASAPALNILIKISVIVALIIASGIV